MARALRARPPDDRAIRVRTGWRPPLSSSREIALSRRASRRSEPWLRGGPTGESRRTLVDAPWSAPPRTCGVAVNATLSISRCGTSWKTSDTRSAGSTRPPPPTRPTTATRLWTLERTASSRRAHYLTITRTTLRWRGWPDRSTRRSTSRRDRRTGSRHRPRRACRRAQATSPARKVDSRRIKNVPNAENRERTCGLRCATAQDTSVVLRVFQDIQLHRGGHIPRVHQIILSDTAFPRSRAPRCSCRCDGGVEPEERHETESCRAESLCPRCRRRVTRSARSRVASPSSGRAAPAPSAAN